jgi:excisionase family DNA binding protein
MNNTDLLKKISEMLAGTATEKPLTFVETCQFLNVSKSTLYKMTHRKQVPYYKPNGKKLYFKKSDLLQWMLKNPVKTQNQIENETST